MRKGSRSTTVGCSIGDSPEIFRRDTATIITSPDSMKIQFPIANLTACLAVLAAGGQGAERHADGSQAESIPQQYVAWARTHAHELALDGASLADAGMEGFARLTAVIGKARLVTIGEPFHGGHEPLAMRNRAIRYCITELGFTAVALETGLSPSKRLYDYVLGVANASDAALAESFSYGFGRFGENLELLHWLRAYNARQPDSRRVRLYGIDMTGQVFPNAYRSLDAVLG
jgi:erythromycin esterase